MKELIVCKLRDINVCKSSQTNDFVVKVHERTLNVMVMGKDYIKKLKYILETVFISQSFFLATKIK